MSPNSLTLSLLAVTSLVHITHAFLNPLMDRRTSNANILVPRQRGGGGSDIYYESCQETYGAGYAECYDSCYNAAAGKTCCEGNYVCFNGEYCGYGLYAYCCYDYQTPQECSSFYDIPQPPADWKPGDGNAPASITDPLIQTYPTSTYLPTYSTKDSYSRTTSSSFSVPLVTLPSITLPSITLPSITIPSITLPSFTPFLVTSLSFTVPTNTPVSGGGVAGAGSEAQGQGASGGRKAPGDVGAKVIMVMAVAVGLRIGLAWL